MVFRLSCGCGCTPTLRRTCVSGCELEHTWCPAPPLGWVEEGALASYIAACLPDARAGSRVRDPAAIGGASTPQLRMAFGRICETAPTATTIFRWLWWRRAAAWYTCYGRRALSEADCAITSPGKTANESHGEHFFSADPPWPICGGCCVRRVAAEHRGVTLGDALAGGRYQLSALLGFSNFSSVWLARDRDTGRALALKVSAAPPQVNGVGKDR
eukprot:151317-Chlamydomonas_euryale.AAC.17